MPVTSAWELRDVSFPLSYGAGHPVAFLGLLLRQLREPQDQPQTQLADGSPDGGSIGMAVHGPSAEGEPRKELPVRK